MSDAESYWSPLCKLVSQLRCWARIAWREGASTQVGWWGQLLTIPTKGYLEAADGPSLLREIEWIEVSTKHIYGGIAGRPLKLIDVKEEILASLQETQLSWELRESTWSVTRLFEEQPVQVVHFVNPFGPSRNATNRPT
jgi:hypothetical protein